MNMEQMNVRTPATIFTETMNVHVRLALNCYQMERLVTMYESSGLEAMGSFARDGIQNFAFRTTKI